ncbi:MAG: GNAT family N-acetyltransferase [Acidimicrobiales bacterium]
MPPTVRTIDAAELPGWVACMGAGFLHDLGEGYADYLAGEVDFERTWAALDDGRVVGTLRSFATEFTVPGPRVVAAAALTNVTVSATHRRAGLLTRMISEDLAAAAERGEQLGILIASEYPIYGRFGYGPAVESASYSIESASARFRQPSCGSVDHVDAATARREAPAVYERFRTSQPGSIERTPYWWDRELRQVEVPGKAPEKSFWALYRSQEGSVEGYLRYRGTPNWDNMRPRHTLVVEELCSSTSAAYQRLWQHCCDIDLTSSIEAGTRSVSEPLGFLLTDGRAVQQTGRHDFIWVRLLDVTASLSARRYPVEGRLVIEVTDDLGLAKGRYLLEGGPTGAECRRSQQSADLTLPVDVLGSIYLGGTSVSALAEAGRIDEQRPGALAEAASLFSSYKAPWCTTWF